MLDTRTEDLRRRLEGLLGIPATEGNALTVLRNGDQIFPAMLEAVRGAQSTIGGRLIDKDLLDHMTVRGVQVEWFRRPVWQGTLLTPLKHNHRTHRTHRKVLVVDQRTGFTGGVGIAEEWTGDARDETEWRDTHVRVVGPAVDGLAAACAQNWAETGHPLWEERDGFPEHEPTGSSVVQVARGSATVGWNDIATTFRVMIESATEHLRLMSACFVPDAGFRRLLVEAAGRGVQVDVMLPGPHADKRVCQLASEAVYEELVQGGVRIWAFQPSMLHAKVLTVDGRACVVGSAHLNRRSMSHDEEVVLTVFDPEVTRRLEDDVDDELPRCVALEPRRWQDRPVRQRAGEAAASLLAHWF